jgi:hypothetical protein
MAYFYLSRLCSKLSLVSASTAGFWGILSLHAMKEPVQSVRKGLMQLLLALAALVNLQRLLLKRSSNHIIKAFLQIPQLILCLLKLPQLVNRGLYHLVIKGPN